MAQHHPGPSRYDWATFLISVLFTLMGFLILSSDRNVGIVTIALFGSCAVVLGATVFRKRRHSRFQETHVEVAGGVPIRESRMRYVALGAWMTVLGLLMWYFGDTYPALFRWLSLAVAAAGVAVLGAIALGRLPSGFLQFDPDGLTVADRTARVAIPWQNVMETGEAELHGNPMLLIVLADMAGIRIDPPDATPRVYKTMAQTQAMYGSHFAIMTSYYGIDLPVLAAAVRRYAGDPGSRAQLGTAQISG